MAKRNYWTVSDKMCELSEKSVKNSSIDPELYNIHQVKRGLRDLNGNGVVTGLTEISTIISSKNINGEKTPCDGELYYRGINVRDLVHGFESENRFGFEETVYLLLFGELPTKEELLSFTNMLNEYRTLPTNFVRDVIMKAPNPDIMNSLARSVLTLYSYDKNANDPSISNNLRQCIQLIANFPMLSVYAYNAYRHFTKGKSLYIHRPSPKLSTAENCVPTKNLPKWKQSF